MKKKLINTLKIIIPVFIGIYIMWYFWSSFDEKAKEAFVNVFKEANYSILALSLVIGLASHLSRAYRWKFMLRAIGYEPPFKNLYNAVMIGYIANIVVPRMGEASRAGVLKGTDNVPFEKGFGTIIAERVIDVAALGIITGIALLMNIDRLDELLALANGLKKDNPEAGIAWGKIIFFSLIGIGVFTAAFLYLKKPIFRAKVRSFIKGFIDGMKTIFTMKDKWHYLLHTTIIWVSYVAMFWITFYSLDRTSAMPVAGIMAAFISGTIGFIITQGGIGTYPIMVGAVVTFFLSPDKMTDLSSIEVSTDIGFGALVWSTQTVLIVVLGLSSLFLVRKAKINFGKQD